MTDPVYITQTMYGIQAEHEEVTREKLSNEAAAMLTVAAAIGGLSADIETIIDGAANNIANLM